jgi:predicted nucleic acid-binding protein
VVRSYVYDGQIEDRRARAITQAAARLPIRLVHAPEFFPRALEMAHFLAWKKAYDAIYLAVAEREDGELLTVDRGMHDAARRLGIGATLVR